MQIAQTKSPGSGRQSPALKWGRTKATVRKRVMPIPRLGKQTSQRVSKALGNDQSTSESAKEAAVVVPIQAVASTLAKPSTSQLEDGVATPQADPAAVDQNDALAISQDTIAPQQPPTVSGVRAEEAGKPGREAYPSAGRPQPSALNAAAAKSSHSQSKRPSRASQAESTGHGPRGALSDEQQEQKLTACNSGDSSFLDKCSAQGLNPVPGECSPLPLNRSCACI